MVRTAEAYRQSLRDGREVRIDNERVKDASGPLDFVRGAASLSDKATILSS